MRELLEAIAHDYRQYRGTGKLPVLFLAAMLILYGLNRISRRNPSTPETAQSGCEKRREISPALFLLSPFTGIACAFCLIREYAKRAEGGPKIRFLRNLAVSGLLVIAIILSGTRVISASFFEPSENTLHIKTEYIMIMDKLLELGQQESVISVIAYPAIAPCLRVYSSKFMPLYEKPEREDALDLSEGARIVYNQFSTSVPDMKQITDIGRREGYEYLITDTGRYYPEFKASEFGYELVETVGDTEIYRLEKGAGKAVGSVEYRNNSDSGGKEQ